MKIIGTAFLVLFISTAAVGCSKSPSAMSVCQQLEAGGVASNCRMGTPEGLNLAATEKADFDLPSAPGHMGSVLRFDKDETYDKTVAAYSSAAMLAGPHRYGSRATRIFVQMNSGAPENVGAKAKAIVDALPDADKSPPVVSTPVASAVATVSAPSSSATPAASASIVSASEVCQKLQAAGVAKNCAPAANGEHFDIEGVASKGTGNVVVPHDDKTFAKYVAGVEALPATSPLKPYFASSKAHVVVHLTSGVSPAIMTKTKSVVDAL